MGPTSALPLPISSSRPTTRTSSCPLKSTFTSPPSTDSTLQAKEAPSTSRRSPDQLRTRISGSSALKLRCMRGRRGQSARSKALLCSIKFRQQCQRSQRATTSGRTRVGTRERRTDSLHNTPSSNWGQSPYSCEQWLLFLFRRCQAFPLASPGFPSFLHSFVSARHVGPTYCPTGCLH